MMKDLAMAPIEMTIEEQSEYQYRVRYAAWEYHAPRDDGRDKIFLANIPPSWLDLVGFMVARKLRDEGGCDEDRQLIIKLQGGDRDLINAPLGVVLNTPLLNTKTVDEK
jgi:hypothetical protein